MGSIQFTLNGEAREASIHDGGTLLQLLREGCGVTSPKDGCSPTGQCGCCTVLVDGQAKVACAFPADRAAGRSVVTLEGVEERERKIYAEAFALTGGVQCGFCIPGIVVRAKHILQKDAAPVARRDRPGPRRAPVPLHRLREDHRRDRARRRRAGGRRISQGRLVGQGRQPDAEVRGRGAGARRSQVHRRSHRARAATTARW